MSLATGANLPIVPPANPDSPFWVEGDAFPTGVVEADNMIVASEDTYNLFQKAFNRDSIDGNGALMDMIFNRGSILDPRGVCTIANDDN